MSWLRKVRGSLAHQRICVQPAAIMTNYFRKSTVFALKFMYWMNPHRSSIMPIRKHERREGGAHAAQTMEKGADVNARD